MGTIARRVLFGTLLSVFLLGAGATSATADDCSTLGGAIAVGECQVTSAVNRAGIFTLDEPLHVTGAGSIAAGSGCLTLQVTGAVTIDVPSVAGGGRIVADVTGTSALGGTVSVLATGDVVLHGDGTKGARVSAEQSSGSCTGGRAGSVNVITTGAVTVENGALVSADAQCSGGAVTVVADGAIDVAGKVTSESNITGTGNVQPPGGGPITLRTPADLVVDATGVVRSQGKAPGADLVHLEGCAVTISGLVESTGPGQAVPNSPANHCGTAPGKAANSTACVEVWAGSTLTINGEVDVDVSQAGGVGHGWMDLFATGAVLITGPTGAGLTYAVHANASVTNAVGGDVTVASTGAGVTTAGGRAIQANATAPGGSGGRVTLAASANVDLQDASIQAEGSGAGAGPQGGQIAARSFNGTTTGTGGELDASGPSGSVTLAACTSSPSYAGTSTPVFVPAADTCGGAPTLPTGVTLPTCGSAIATTVRAGLNLSCGRVIADRGGSAKSACMAEWMVVGVGSKNPFVSCKHGAACDIGGSAGCVFRASLCFNDAANAMYGSKCKVEPVNRVSLNARRKKAASTVNTQAVLDALTALGGAATGQRVGFSTPLGDTTCTAPFDLSIVPKKSETFTTVTQAGKKKDQDIVRFTCKP